MEFIESLLRWIHVVAGIAWIGLLYFFNWVNSTFAPTMDAETKKKVVPELLPRTLYFFRWGAAYTWISGALLILLVYYHDPLTLFELDRAWGLGAIIMLLVVWLGVFVYDPLYKNVFKDPKVGFVAGLILSGVVIYLLRDWAGFSYRGYAIHLGTLFGTIMAYNVWFRIWPAQQKIITAVKQGEAPDAALVALAGTRSKHNTYMSVPLVFTMVSRHATWAATSWIYMVVVVLVGWAVVYWLYNKSKEVKGF